MTFGQDSSMDRSAAPAAGPGRGWARVPAAVLLPFVPLAVAFLLARISWFQNGSDLVMVLIGLLIPPALSALAPRITGSARTAVVAIALAAVGWAALVDAISPTSADGVEPRAALEIGANVALYAAVAGLGAWIARPAGTRRRAVLGFLAPLVLLFPLLVLVGTLLNPIAGHPD